jgi:hypothetical protein
MLETKNEIRLYRVMEAGMYEIRGLDIGISEDIIFKIGKGEPFEYAYRDAERLAIIINCDLYLDDTLIREEI